MSFAVVTDSLAGLPLEEVARRGWWSFHCLTI